MSRRGRRKSERKQPEDSDGLSRAFREVTSDEYFFAAPVQKRRGPEAQREFDNLFGGPKLAPIKVSKAPPLVDEHDASAFWRELTGEIVRK